MKENDISYYFKTIKEVVRKTISNFKGYDKTSSSGLNPTSGEVAGADLASSLAPVQRVALFHSHSLQIFLCP